MNLENAHVVVLGLAKSGRAVARLLHHLGAHVVVNDQKPREDCSGIEELESLGIEVICGSHPPDLFEQRVDFVVKNPGIPYRIQPIQQAIYQGIPVLTEVEIAGQLCPVPIIGITGSNGKTTTTSLVGEMLKQSGLRARVAGNIGQALTEVVQEMEADEWLVAELSSFQLKGTHYFHPKVGALLNVYPAHLDYHESMEDYIASKQKLFVRQGPQDVAVLNAHPDQTICQEIAQRIHSTIWWFSTKEKVSPGVYVQDGWIQADLPQGETDIPILDLSEFALPGEVNVENAVAASAIALSCGGSIEGVRETLRSFQGVPHRLEYVTTIEGVRFFNDSKATNAKAAISALSSFQDPMIWIAGGLNRGTEFHELTDTLKNQPIKAAILYGEAAPILAKRAEEAGIQTIFLVREIEEAVKQAKEIAEAEDVVLLSPACASWDLYTSFEERGSIFKQAVHSL